MRTFKIPAGAERNAANGFVLALEKPDGDKMYISGIAADTLMRLYKVEDTLLSKGRTNISVIVAGELEGKLARLEEAEEIIRYGPNGGL